MTRTVHSAILNGIVKIPPSKSLSHRAILAAALADGESTIENLVYSEDIEATLEAIMGLGVEILKSKHSLKIMGRSKLESPIWPLHCKESGSTLRFLIPFASLVEGPVVFTGEGKLCTRPLDPYFDIFDQQGIRYSYNGKLPLLVEGQLKADVYRLPGNISSQFVTGLMYVLPLLDGDSEIILTSPLESRDYVELTIQVLNHFGINVETVTAEHYIIRGNQHYRPARYRVEGDFSQSAFWIAAGLMGNGLELTELDQNTRQGDKRILEIVDAMGGNLKWENGMLKVTGTKTKGAVIDASQCPDLVPIVATLAAVSLGETRIINAGRVRIKESDRLHAICTELNKLGANIQEEPECLVINGVESLTGGITSGWEDHRIVMSLAVAAMKCDGPLTIEGSDAVRKSYPHFFADFKALGGMIHEK